MEIIVPSEVLRIAFCGDTGSTTMKDLKRLLHYSCY